VNLWFPKPLYESLPYVYGALGLAFAIVSWVGATGLRSAILLIAGCGLLLISLVLWLRRHDYRRMQREYDSHSLDDT
jgi:Flp pilus assembly protein TadB